MKKVKGHISVVSSWAKILNIRFDRARFVLQNPTSHESLESVFRDFAGIDFWAALLPVWYRKNLY